MKLQLADHLYPCWSQVAGSALCAQVCEQLQVHNVTVSFLPLVSELLSDVQRYSSFQQWKTVAPDCWSLNGALL